MVSSGKDENGKICELSRDMRNIQVDTRNVNRCVNDIQIDIDNMKSQQQILRLHLDVIVKRIDGIEIHSAPVDQRRYRNLTRNVQDVEVISVDKLEPYSRGEVR